MALAPSPVGNGPAIFAWLLGLMVVVWIVRKLGSVAPRKGRKANQGNPEGTKRRKPLAVDTLNRLDDVLKKARDQAAAQRAVQNEIKRQNREE